MSDEGPSFGRLLFVFYVLMAVAFGTMWGWVRHIFVCDYDDKHSMLDCPLSQETAKKYVRE